MSEAALNTREFHTLLLNCETRKYQYSGRQKQSNKIEGRKTHILSKIPLKIKISKITKICWKCSITIFQVYFWTLFYFFLLHH